MPFEYLMHFEGKIFELPGSINVVQVQETGKFEGYDSYSKRLFQFVTLPPPSNVYNFGTRVETAYPIEDFIKTYPVYLDPIELNLNEGTLNLLYRKFFKTGFPFILPPTYATLVEDGYFSDKSIRVRKELDILIHDRHPELPAQSILGYTIWKGMDQSKSKRLFKGRGFFSIKK